MQGLKDGGAVVGGQIAARKIRGAVTGMLPADMQTKVRTGIGHIGLSIASAVTVSLVTRRFLPGSPALAAVQHEIWDDNNLGNAIPGATPRARIDVRTLVPGVPLVARAGRPLLRPPPP